MNQVTLEEYEVRFVTTRLALRESEAYYSADPIRQPEDAVKVAKSHLQHLDVEELLVANLDSQNTPINFHIVSRGTVSGSMAMQRDIFKTAILSGAAAVMLFHNHPSGKVKPSEEDTQLTKDTIAAGKLMGIPLVDHIIIGATGAVYSFQKNSSLFA